MSPDDISLFEDKAGIKLPSSYRKYIEEYNVFSVEPYGYFFKPINEINADESPTGELGLFFGFSEKHARTLEWAIENYWKTQRIKREYLPIAHGGGGKVICVGVTHNTNGKIYCWNNERELDTDYLPIEIADNIEFFLGSLR